MTRPGPLQVLEEVTQLLDRLQIKYVLGGSMASTLIGEPRSTVDLDIAVSLERDELQPLLGAFGDDYYVPNQAAKDAVEAAGSFNVLHHASNMKIDLFVLGEGLLDQRQIRNRIKLSIPGSEANVWVTAPGDLILRKLDCYRQGGRVSDRQWRDILGIISAQRGTVDLEDTRRAAEDLGLLEDLERALLSNA